MDSSKQQQADHYRSSSLGGSGTNISDHDHETRPFSHVRVVHNFRASNNDELCLKKDDIITLTQTPSGGWWEGTLDGNTGWFPANYVAPVLPGDPIYEASAIHQSSAHGIVSDHLADGNGLLQSANQFGGSNTSNNAAGGNGPASLTSLDGSLNGDCITEYRAIVIKDIEDSENVFIQALQDAIVHYLKPIYQYKIFPSDSEINAVLRSITEICSVHRRFLTSIDKNKSLSPKENRIGGLFLQFAPQFKHAHFEYCSHHARFVHLIEKYKKEICAFFAQNAAQPSSSSSSSAASSSPSPSSLPNVLITSSLSVSFRRLDKYPALLQELQRYTEESHIDRGDTQRAGFLYREIAMSCLELRRRKEMELEVMLGNIRNFDGLKIENYGNIQRMEPVSIMILPPWSEPKKDCYIVLFPKVLMILSVGCEMTSFSYESMLQLDGARIPVINFNDSGNRTKTDGYAYRLEIQGTSAHPLSDSELTLTYMVQFADEAIWKEWYQLLQKQIRLQSAASIIEQQSSSSSSSSTAGNNNNNNVTSPTNTNNTTTTASTPSGGLSSNPHSSLISSSSSSSSSSSNGVAPSALAPLAAKPPMPSSGAKHPHPPTPPPAPPPHHRAAPVAPPSISSGGNIINTASSAPHFHRPALAQAQSPTRVLAPAATASAIAMVVPRHGTYWSDRILTPHTPRRPDSANLASSAAASSSSSSAPDFAALDQNEDLQLLNLIDSYYRKFPPPPPPLPQANQQQTQSTTANTSVGSKLSNTTTNISEFDQYELDGSGQRDRQLLVEILEPRAISAAADKSTRFFGNQSTKLSTISSIGGKKNSLQSLAGKLNQISSDRSNCSLDRAILCEIYEQLRQMRHDITHLHESFEEERRQRERLRDALFLKQ